MSPESFLQRLEGAGWRQSKLEEGTFVVEKTQHPRIKVELPLDYSIAVPREHRGNGSGCK